MGGPEEEEEREQGAGQGPPPLKRARLDLCASAIADLSLTSAAGAGGSFASAEQALEFARARMAGLTPGVPPGEDERVGSKQQIRKVEYVRLLEQALYSLGYFSAAARLEEESHVPLQSPAVATFRNGVLGGRWDECCALLAHMQLGKEALHSARFLILQQKFLECLEAADTAGALRVLRGELAPLGTNTRRLHALAGWVMCTSRADLLGKAEWSGAGGDSRLRLLGELQALLPPALMVPERRLERLVEQALECQRAACVFHNTTPDAAFSLFSDHQCGRDQIPTQTTQVLEDHTDEVWYLHFSHDGRRLASASKDQTVIIWEVGDGSNGRVQHVLVGHSKPLSFVAWSPDDRLLLTCGNDLLVKLWDTHTGACRHTLHKHTEPVTACAWFPDSRRFVSGGLDKCLYMWDVDGAELDMWKAQRQPRINDLAISDDGKHMVSICNEKEIRIFNFEEREERIIPETQSITSLCLSADGRCLLVNVSSQEIHLWDLGGGGGGSALPDAPSFVYRGQRQGRFVIRSCFGGSEQAFIVSGSEDSQVYIWHRGNGELLEVLPGHSGTVNAVSWNPVNPHMFATASDDHTVRLWGLARDSPKSGVSPPAAEPQASPPKPPAANGAAN
eukprot:jgi/Mesen1/7342/ME000377S06567